MRRFSTAAGEVTVKIVTLPEGEVRWKIEHDDVVRIADRSGQDYLSTHRALTAAVADAIGPDGPDAMVSEPRS